MTQQTINIGTGPDSYTGDTLRTAFEKTNSNFDELYANSVSATSNLTVRSLTATGNVNAAYYFGDGSNLTGITAEANYGNSNVASYLPVYTGNVNARYYFGNGSQLTGITSTANLGNLSIGGVANQTIVAGANSPLILKGYNGSVVGIQLANDNTGNLANLVFGATTSKSIDIFTLTNAAGKSPDLTIRTNNAKIIFDGTTGAMSFLAPNAVGYSYNFYSGSVYAQDFYANANLPTGYQFTTPMGLTGFSHTYQNDINGNVSLVKINHDNSTPAKFYENNTTLLSGNLVVVQRGSPTGNFPNAFVQTYSKANTYTQFVWQNLDSNAAATGDIVVTADTGTDTKYYLDIGMTSSGYVNTHPDNSLGTSVNALDGYIYVQGSAGNVGGNLTIGTTTVGTEVKVLAGGVNSANVVAKFTSTGLMPGANVTYSLGSATQQWKDLWLSNSTLYLGNTPITVDNGTLSVNGNVVGTASTGNIAFIGSVIELSDSATETQIDISPSGPVGGWAYLQLPTNNTANIADTRLHNDAGNIEIATGDFSTGSNSYNWYFTNSGKTTFPVLQVTRGDVPSTSITAPTLLLGDPNYNGVTISTPDGDANVPNSSRLIINPGQGREGSNGEGGDIYLWAGRGGNGDGTTGGGTGGDIKIRGGQGMAQAAGGYIRIEAGDSQADIGDAGYIEMYAGSTAGGTPGYVDIRGGYNGSGAGGDSTIRGGQGSQAGGKVELLGGYGGGAAGGDIDITPGGSALGLGSYGNINLNPGASQFIFDNLGKVTIPGVIRIADDDAKLTLSPSSVRIDVGTGTTYVDIQDEDIFFISNTTVINSAGSSWEFSPNGSITSSGGWEITTGGNITAGNLLVQNIRTIEAAVHIGQGAGLSNQGNFGIAMGRFAGSQNQGAASLAIGQLAGQTSQGNTAIALGLYAAASTQSANAVAIGTYAGRYSQGISSVAIGELAGNSSQSSYAIAIGQNAGAASQGAAAVGIGIAAGTYNQGYVAVGIGSGAGANNQGQRSVAIGVAAGTSSQGNASVAIGDNAAAQSQGNASIALGTSAGAYSQGSNAAAIGFHAGINSQGSYSIAIGDFAANSGQATAAVAIGMTAGYQDQGQYSVAIGQDAARVTQGQDAIAVGSAAGRILQGIAAVSIGSSAGINGQGPYGVALGAGSGAFSQSAEAVAIGLYAGTDSQGARAIAIGANAGINSQGTDSIAIGSFTGAGSQVSNSIALNASGTALNPANSGFYVNPIRAVEGSTVSLHYDTSTNEVTYSANAFIGNTYVPSAAGSAGTKGQITFDGSYVYICVANNTWKRANLSTW